MVGNQHTRSDHHAGLRIVDRGHLRKAFPGLWFSAPSHNRSILAFAWVAATKDSRVHLQIGSSRKVPYKTVNRLSKMRHGFKLIEKGTEPKVPAELAAALRASPAAAEAWKQLTPIARRDFVSWINQAKQPVTRARRIERCRENLIKGKRRPCCYAVVPMDLYKALGADPKAKAQWSDLSASEKRDFSDWVEDSDDKVARKARIEEACEKLVAGKRSP